MNRAHYAVAGFLVAASLAATAQAQEQEANPAAPVELYACTFRDGKGMDDMLKQNAKWKKWADGAMATYSAWMITPNFRTSDDEFDFGWIGSWLNGEDMGKSLDVWHKEGQELQKGYFEIADCSHSLMTSVEVNAPDGPPSGDGLVWFSSCTIAEGSDHAAAYQAHKEMSAAFRSMGGKGQSWLFYPALGAGDIEFDYYGVTSFKSYAELGAGWEMYANGGGWQKQAKIMGGKVSCDSPRLYDATMVKNGGPRG